MPKYFFDFETGRGSWPDEEGSELPDAEAARSQAVRTLAEMAKDIVDGKAELDLRVMVRGDDGAWIYEASMTLAGRWLAEAGH